MTAPGRPFDCELCGQTFTTGWSDEQATAEHEVSFGVAPAKVGPVGEVCDDCYALFLDWWNALTPEQQAVAEKKAREIAELAAARQRP